MYSAPTRTVQEAIDYIERIFGDESGVQIEPADLVMFINNAVDEINTTNRVLKESVTFPSVAGTNVYTFPERNILQVEAILYDGRLVRNVSYAHALENFIGVAPTTGYTDTSVPLYWWEWAGKFTFWPTPGEGTIQLDYTVRHQPVSLDDLDALLPLPDKYYTDVLTATLRQAYDLDEQPELAGAQREALLASLSRKAEEERQAQKMYYEVITLIDD
jgi:hypothetical protein